MPKKNPRRTDKEWLDLIQECRSSGLSDKCWCQEHHIHTSNFYYQIRRLRQKACEIPEPVHSSFSGKQEVVPLSFEEPAVCPSSVQLKTDTIPDSVIKITYHSFQIEITNAADRETEYSCAMKSHFRKFGNQMSGSGNHLCNYASLLA